MGCSHVTYEFGKLTDWLTAVGTVGVFVWALVLARRDNKEQLSIASLYFRSKGALPDEMTIVAFNSGKLPIAITKATVEIGRIFPAAEPSFQIIQDERALPKIVHPQTFFLMHMDLSPHVNYIPDKIHRLWVKRWRIDRSIFLVVTTATGHRFRHRFAKKDTQHIAKEGD